MNSSFDSFAHSQFPSNKKITFPNDSTWKTPCNLHVPQNILDLQKPCVYKQRTNTFFYPESAKSFFKSSQEKQPFYWFGQSHIFYNRTFANDISKPAQCIMTNGIADDFISRQI